MGKDEAASLKIMVNSELITVAIEASKNRDVAVIDLPGAHLYADIDELVIIVMRDQLAELMAETVPVVYHN